MTESAANPDPTVTATVVLRRRNDPPAAAFAAAALPRAAFAQRYGADPSDVQAVQDAATSAGLDVVSADSTTRLMRVRGSADALRAFSAPQVLAVLGIDEARIADPRLRVAHSQAVSTSYTPLQLATAYGMPQADGSGQTIAIIELGGGFGQADLDSYFGGLGLPTPAVEAVSVDGAVNLPGQDPGADGEVLLDIEVAGAIAPAAKILVYFAPNTDAGFLDAVTQAAHATPAPTAISISWGQSEDQWSPEARQAMDAAFADAALLGVTVLAAAGDSGSSDNQPQGAPHCDFPASSPHVLGCGGTSLQVGASGAVDSETVWNDGGQGGSTGGGVSDAFALPSYQGSVGVPLRAGKSAGRGVPDVAAVADPQTGYRVLVDGQPAVIGGTSAVAPLWAGLICRLAQVTGRRFGLLHPVIYAGAASLPIPGFRDITSGNNGAYKAEAGWDPCTGLGVPDGPALLELLRSAPM
ncbi:MAG TPA: S53 family peptidase [Jatrophihabitans sp.]|nr:S53 family peptidase [Jatrophihabitans sp.]